MVGVSHLFFGVGHHRIFYFLSQKDHVPRFVYWVIDDVALLDVL